MHLRRIRDDEHLSTIRTPEITALFLRIGLGATFITGGLWKLARSLDADQAAGFPERYTASDGKSGPLFLCLGAPLATPRSSEPMLRRQRDCRPHPCAL